MKIGDKVVVYKGKPAEFVGKITNSRECVDFYKKKTVYEVNGETWINGCELELWKE